MHFSPHPNDVLQKKIYSLIKVLGWNEPGSAGKKAVVFLTVWRQSVFHGEKRISLSWILQWTPWEGTISFLLIGKNWDIVSRGREPNNSCTHILLQEIKINGSCAIMKWHFLEQILENSDSFRMQTTKFAQAGIEGLSAWSVLITNGQGGCETHTPVRCPAIVSQLWTLRQLPGLTQIQSPSSLSL